MSIKLLVYGSLLNPKSASAGMGREIKLADYHDIEITGYRLDYNVLESVEVSQKTMQVCFLNLTKQEGSSLQTKYLLITEDELKGLVSREKNYQLINVNNHCIPRNSSNVFTFVGTPEHLIYPENKAVILGGYISKVTKGVCQFDSSFAKKFLANLEKASNDSKVIQGDYRFISSLQNSMTDCIEA